MIGLAQLKVRVTKKVARMKFNSIAAAGAVKSAIMRIKGASKKKKAALVVGVVAGTVVGLDPDLVGGLIEYFMIE